MITVPHVVQCSNKSVGRVPYGIPYGTRQILLMNNYIKGIQLDLFAKYNSMEVLVLSNNWLTDGAIKGAFSQIPALKHLYLDGNRLKSVPTDLPVSLEELRLDNNYLRAISEGAWSRCPGLFILRLSNNNLGPGSIPDAALSSLRNLHTLSLDHNQLTSIPLGLPLLIKELYLKGNLIEQVREDAFHKMWALEVLDLSANRLTNAGLRNSLNATRLENLCHNALQQVPRQLPRGLHSVALTDNRIQSVPHDAFCWGDRTRSVRGFVRVRLNKPPIFTLNCSKDDMKITILQHIDS
uniref:Uncharacterized protein n=1 Tax=Salarias fasciatus TaxID=181472 RepID=A0A672J798_SALFA